MKSVLDHPRIKDLHPAGTSCETGPQFLGLTQQTFTFNYQYWTNRDGTPLTTYTGQIGMVQNFVKPIRIQENFVIADILTLNQSFKAFWLILGIDT